MSKRKKDSNFLFNTIAPVYALFYRRQKDRFQNVIDHVKDKLDLTSYKTILDVGCGTGALCAVLYSRGLTVTGIDAAEKMLNIAKTQPDNEQVRFVRASILDRLPFDDKSFDISIASYVAHGLPKSDRKKMYQEMSRVTKSKVIIYDYNRNRSPLTSLIEWLEGGDYFRFIREAESEMTNCVTELSECFSDVTVLDADKRAAWYVGAPF